MRIMSHIDLPLEKDGFVTVRVLGHEVEEF